MEAVAYEGCWDVNVNELQYCQRIINPRRVFQDGRPMSEPVQGLISGKITPFDVEPLTVVLKDQKITLSHRRV